MRKSAMTVALAVLLVACGTALAGETVKVPLLNGVYSVEAPAEWYVEQNEDGIGSFSPERGSPYSVIFFPPNPDVEGEIEEYAGVITGVLIGRLGGMVTNEEELDFYGKSAVLFHFAIPAGESSVQAIGMVVDFDGYGVLCLALGPDENFADFLDIAGKIMGSYEIDEDELEGNAELLQNLANRLVDELAEMLQ